MWLPESTWSDSAARSYSVAPLPTTPHSGSERKNREFWKSPGVQYQNTFRRLSRSSHGYIAHLLSELTGIVYLDISNHSSSSLLRPGNCRYVAARELPMTQIPYPVAPSHPFFEMSKMMPSGSLNLRSKFSFS